MKFWKSAAKEEVQIDESAQVTLKNGKTMSIAEMMNAMEAPPAAEVAKEKVQQPLCNGEHEVMVGDKRMSVNELVAAHIEATKPKEPAKVTAEKSPADLAAEKKNADEEKEKKEKSDKEELEKKNAAFKELQNAHLKAGINATRSTVEVSEDQVKRGSARYG